MPKVRYIKKVKYIKRNLFLSVSRVQIKGFVLDIVDPKTHTKYLIVVLCKNREEKTPWMTISSEHNDTIGFDLSRMDYIRRSNIIKISGEIKIVTELGIELPTSLIIIISKKMSFSSVSSGKSFPSISNDTSALSVLE